MPTLILDLDETVIVAKKRIKNQNFLLSENSYLATCSGTQTQIYIINPPKISQLIEKACTKYDGIILFTSGFWSEDIRKVLANALDLSPESKKKVKHCQYFSPYTESLTSDFDAETLRNMPKGRRFTLILASQPELSAKNFVLLDDNAIHINSFSNHPNVTAILATPGETNQAFYHIAEVCLRNLLKKEIDAFKLRALENLSTLKYGRAFFQPGQRFCENHEIEQQEAIESIPDCGH